jgi:hypothetical protein
LLRIANAFYLLDFSLIVKFADLPLGIRQSVLKEKIRSAVVRKVERSSRQPLTLLTNDKCKKNLYYRVALCHSAAKESPVCEQAFKNIYSIFQRRWKCLKKAALESDPGPIQHGNVNKRNRHKGSFAATTKDDVIDFLVDLGKKEGESYATRFIRERTSILIRKDEEDLMELPSSYSKRKIYEK